MRIFHISNSFLKIESPETRLICTRGRARPVAVAGTASRNTLLRTLKPMSLIVMPFTFLTCIVTILIRPCFNPQT